MGARDIFVSVGGPANEQQEDFIRSVEDRLRAEGLVPHTVGRNEFAADAPLKTVTRLLRDCSGTVVIALERSYFSKGVERRGGPKQADLKDIRLATPWNQIEAALAYSYGHPLLVIVEKGLKAEGLLEKGNDWYVQSIAPDPSSLSTNEFNGVLSDWRNKLIATPAGSFKSPQPPEELTIGDLLKGLRPKSLWGLTIVAFTLLSAAFALGGLLASKSLATPKESSQVTKPPVAEITKIVCTGEFEEKCAGTHDMFFTCATGFSEESARRICLDAGRPKARSLTVNSSSDNNCGYSLVKVTCTD
jgi:hypothetical protein